jgi:hypothetical protein
LELLLLNDDVFVRSVVDALVPVPAVVLAMEAFAALGAAAVALPSTLFPVAGHTLLAAAILCCWCWCSCLYSLYNSLHQAGSLATSLFAGLVGQLDVALAAATCLACPSGAL